jgi:hypothetical protein
MDGRCAGPLLVEAVAEAIEARSANGSVLSLGRSRGLSLTGPHGILAGPVGPTVAGRPIARSSLACATCHRRSIAPGGARPLVGSSPDRCFSLLAGRPRPSHPLTPPPSTPGPGPLSASAASPHLPARSSPLLSPAPLSSRLHAPQTLPRPRCRSPLRPCHAHLPVCRRPAAMSASGPQLPAPLHIHLGGSSFALRPRRPGLRLPAGRCLGPPPARPPRSASPAAGCPTEGPGGSSAHRLRARRGGRRQAGGDGGEGGERRGAPAGEIGRGRGRSRAAEAEVAEGRRERRGR